MIKIKYEGKIFPKEFVSERSANICINKLIKAYIKENVPASTKKYQKVSKEYLAGIRNKFSLVVDGVRLRKALHNEKSLGV